MKQVGSCLHICIASLLRLLLAILVQGNLMYHQTLCACKALASMLHEP